MIHKANWKDKALLECGLKKNPRLIFTVLVYRADFKGRVKETYEDIGKLCNLSSKTVQREIPILTATGLLRLIQHGEGRRPNWYEIPRFWEPGTVLTTTRCTFAAAYWATKPKP